MSTRHNKYIYNKKKKSFKSENHKVYTVTINKSAVSNGDDKEIQDEGRITTYLHRSNIPFIKYFDDKDTPNSI